MMRYVISSVARRGLVATTAGHPPRRVSPFDVSEHYLLLAAAAAAAALPLALSSWDDESSLQLKSGIQTTCCEDSEPQS